MSQHPAVPGPPLQASAQEWRERLWGWLAQRARELAWLTGLAPAPERLRCLVLAGARPQRGHGRRSPGSTGAAR